MVDAHVVGLGARVAEGHSHGGAVGRLDLVTIGIVEGDVERDDDLRVSLLLGDGILDLGEHLAGDGLCGEVPALGQHSVIHADRDGHAIDDEALGAGEHGGRRSGLGLGCLGLDDGLGLDRRLHRGVGFDRRLGLDSGVRLNRGLGLDDGLLLYHDFRLDLGVLLNGGLLRLDERILDDDRIHTGRCERLRCLLEGICHPLCGEQLPHEDEREDPCKRTPRALAETAELLTHDQHLSF